MKLFKKITSKIKNIKYVLLTYKLTELILENPFYIINNKIVRRLFVLPNIVLSCGTVKKLSSWANALFGLYFCSISYKNKFNNWRFEEEPFVQLNLFGLYIRLSFKCPIHTVSKYGYWESILDLYFNYIYNNKQFNLYNIINHNTFSSYTSDGIFKKEDMTLVLTPIGYIQYHTDAACAKQDEIE